MSKVSIIVPIFNAESHIGECLESIKRQTYTNLEVILINDGSHDNSGLECKKYVDNDKRFIYVEQINKGVCEARNKGLEIATGEYIFFSDADDWLEHECIQKLYDSILANRTDLSIANLNVVINGNKIVKKVFDKPFSTDSQNWINKYQMSCIGYGYNPNPGTKMNLTGLGSIGNKLYKSKIIKEFDIRFDARSGGIFEDNLFVLHYLEFCNSVSYIDDVVYNYRKVNDSNSQGFKAETLDINQNIFSLINEFIYNYKISQLEEYNKAFYIYVIRRLYDSLGAYFFAGNKNKSNKESIKELKQVINSKPYSEAIKNVDYKLLNYKNHRIVWYGAKLNSPRLIWLTYNLRSFLESIIRN